MKDPTPFELPGKIDQLLATLSKLYAREGEQTKQEIIVNSQVRVHEEWTRDNTVDGEFYGHALYLTVPENLYLSSVQRKYELQEGIKRDINAICDIQDEYVDVVFLEMESGDPGDWRRESGVLQSPRRVISPEATTRVWGGSGYRLFLSHKAEVKAETGRLKSELQEFGVSCFVAHEDIHPTKAWQDEIENALASMDAFVALMTEEFHDSDWTDQEVGIALAKGVPIIAVKLGRDPYGFIGKFQALSSTWDNAAQGILGILIQYPKMVDAYLEACQQCRNFDHGNRLSELLPKLSGLTEEQQQRLVSAYNTNGELRGSFGFNGTKPYTYGDGLVAHLNRIAGPKYQKLSGFIEAMQG